MMIRAHIYVLLATLLVAGSFIASEKLSGIINPYSLTLLRFIGAALLLLPLVLLNAKRRRAFLSTLPRTILMSFFYATFFICLFTALETTNALNTGALYTLVPLATALLSLLFLKQSISGKQLVIYGLGIVATGWVVFKGQWSLLQTFSLNSGDWIFMLGSLAMCGYSLSMKLLYRQDDMILLVFANFVGGALWMTLALWVTDSPLQWHLIQADAFYNMAYLIVGATLVTVYLYQRATVVLGPAKVMAYTYLSPAAVALLLLLVDGIAIAPVVIPGVLLSALATVILQRRATEVAKKPLLTCKTC